MQRLRTVLFCVLALATLPARAHAHLRLESSKPAQGDTVRDPLTQISLVFSQEVEARYTVVTLLDATGRVLGFGTLRPVGASPTKEFVLVLERPLMAGAFTVKWKTAAADGHAVTGMFDFVVDAVASGTETETDTVGGMAGHHVEEADIAPLYRPESSLAWIFTRWLNFLALVLMVGTVAFRFGVLERARKLLLDETLVLNVDRDVRRLAVIAATAALLSNAARLWLQSGMLHGSERMWESTMLSSMIFDTGWGKAWLAQSVAAAGFLIAALVKSEDRLESWFSAGAFAVIAASTPAFSGHAAAVQQMAIVPVVDDAIHVITASSWLGTLMVLLFAGLPNAVRSENGFAKAATLVNIFSPFALVMAGITVFTGTLNGFVHIAAISDLWGTEYGRILALKVAVVVVTATIGAYNWRVMKPRLGTEAATGQIKKSARSEAAVAVVIILITAVLVGTPPR